MKTPSIHVEEIILIGDYPDDWIERFSGSITDFVIIETKSKDGSNLLKIFSSDDTPDTKLTLKKPEVKTSTKFQKKSKKLQPLSHIQV